MTHDEEKWIEIVGTTLINDPVIEVHDDQGNFGYGNFGIFNWKNIVAYRPKKSGWQPIETAPKDGTKILGTDHDDVFEMIFIRHFEVSTQEFTNGWTDDYEHLSEFYPTHWMPLPEPPL